MVANTKIAEREERSRRLRSGARLRLNGIPTPRIRKIKEAKRRKWLGFRARSSPSQHQR